MSLTLKLTDPARAAELPQFCERIRSWGYAAVSARQLTFNRQELCVAATLHSIRPSNSASHELMRHCATPLAFVRAMSS